MPGLLSLLPLLEGWNYHIYVVDTTPITTTTKFLKKIETDGWLVGLSLLTTDAYGTLRVRFRGTGGRWLVSNIAPEPAFTLGLVQQDPSGWVTLYNRPIAALTVGLYQVYAFTEYENRYSGCQRHEQWGIRRGNCLFA